MSKCVFIEKRPRSNECVAAHIFDICVSLVSLVSRDGQHRHQQKRLGGPSALANSARRGHPRTVPYAKMSSKGRTELQKSLSRAKNCEEVAGDVRFCVAPQKLHKNCV